MEKDICIICHGFGEYQALSNPSDPSDGSYTLEDCPGCAGTGLGIARLPVRNINPKEHRHATEKAVESILQHIKERRS